MTIKVLEADSNLMSIDEILAELEANLNAGNLSRRTFALMEEAIKRVETLKEEKPRRKFLTKVNELSTRLELVKSIVTTRATNNIREELNEIISHLENILEIANSVPRYFWLGSKIKQLQAKIHILSLQVMFGNLHDQLQNGTRRYSRANWRNKKI